MLGLLAEKPARIEGALVENLFIRDMVSPSFKEYSSGWWFTIKDGTKDGFVAVKQLALNEVVTHADTVVSKALVASGRIKDVIFVYPQSDGFGWIAYEHAKRYVSFNELQPHLKPLQKKRASRTTNNSSDLIRLNWAIKELCYAGFLPHVQAERQFASNYLNQYSWDVDAFAIWENSIVAFEVKQKFPTRYGTFGINEGLMRLFLLLGDIGIPVWHIILTKPVWQKDFSAISLLKTPYCKAARWIGTRIDLKNLAASRSRRSPKYTSLYKESELIYRDIPCTEFYLIKKFMDTDCKLGLISLLEGKCVKLSSVKDIPNVEPF